MNCEMRLNLTSLKMVELEESVAHTKMSGFTRWMERTGGIIVAYFKVSK
jgi:hypothetical protein